MGRRAHLEISQAGGAAGWCEGFICVWGLLMGLGISTWYLYQQSKGRGRGAAPRPCWGKDAQLISSRGKPPREEESHISSAKRHVMTQGKKKSHFFITQIHLPVPDKHQQMLLFSVALLDSGTSL